MTMLDRMRRHKGWLKWSLVLVILAFIVFYVPDFLAPGDRLPDEVVAKVEGREIKAGDFRRAYQAQLQAYRNAYGANISEQMLRQLGIEQQILQQMVDQRAALAEAERLGIRVTDREVAERIFSLPAFQEDGRFIGEQRYAQILAVQRPPISQHEFEESLRQSLVLERLRAALTDWVNVTERDVEEEFRRRHEKVKLDVAAISHDTLRDEVTVSDEEVQAYFEANAEDYRIGERRRLRYLLVDIEAIRAAIAIQPQEVERYYDDNIDLFTTPEQVRASHVLLTLDEDKPEEEMRQAAEKIAQQARAGADFAELARKHSQDPGSASEGGDLDYFGRDRMVPAFEEVAFSLEPGAVSDPVRTEFGYHVIKVTDKRPALTQPLDEVREQIAAQLREERAQAQARTLAQALDEEIKRPADLDRVARARGMTVQETGLFTRDEPVMALGMSMEVNAVAFGMQENQVSDALRVGRGYAFIMLAGRQDPYTPQLDEVRDRVRENVVRTRLEAAAEERLSAQRELFGSDFAKAAKQVGVEVKTTELITRDSPIPDIGISPEVEAAAFSLPVGGVSEPIEAGGVTAVIRVVEREEPNFDELAEEREELRLELLMDRQNRFFSAYMVKAKQRMNIEVNRQALERLMS
jgi:peptidyl-prolyl cis-trans isomerase D